MLLLTHFNGNWVTYPGSHHASKKLQNCNSDSEGLILELVLLSRTSGKVVHIYNFAHAVPYFGTCITNLSNTCIFSVMHIAALLCIGTLDSTVRGGYFKQWNYQQKSQEMQKTWHWIDWEKDICLAWELKQECRVSPFQFQLGMCLPSHSKISAAVHVLEWLQKHYMYSFLGYK